MDKRCHENDSIHRHLDCFHRPPQNLASVRIEKAFASRYISATLFTAMIQGLFATVTAEALREPCLKHARQHQSSVEQLDHELQSRRKSQEPEELEDETTRLIDFHKNKITELQFFADHLEEGEKYRLSREDLCFLGIIRPDHDFSGGYEDFFDDEEIPF